MKQEPTLPHSVTIPQIEAYLDRVALAITHNPDGPAMLPMFEWLERQLETKKREQATMDSVRERIAALKKKL